MSTIKKLEFYRRNFARSSWRTTSVTKLQKRIARRINLQKEKRRLTYPSINSILATTNYNSTMHRLSRSKHFSLVKMTLRDHGPSLNRKLRPRTITRPVPLEKLYPRANGENTGIAFTSISVTPQQFVDWKPIQKVDAEIQWPIDFTPIFAISMRNERMKGFRGRMGKWSDLLYHWPATDGRRIEMSVAHARNIITPHARLNRGQLGCFHSHVRLWKFIIQQNLSSAFICEDDADINYNQKTADDIKDVADDLKITSREWDILYLGHNITNRSANEKNKISRRLSVPQKCAGLFAYIITKRGCEILLEKASPYDVAVDLYVADMINSGRLKALAACPSLCYVVPVASDTEGIK